jgi:hypothetical protein
MLDEFEGVGRFTGTPLQQINRFHHSRNAAVRVRGESVCVS